MIYNDIYFYKEKNECDFIIKEGIRITKAIQVTADFSSAKQRELSGLIEAMDKFKLKAQF